MASDGVSHEQEVMDNIVSAISHLRKAEMFTDVEFAVVTEYETRHFSAHRLILSIRSSVFADMFQGPDLFRQNIVEVRDLSISGFDCMLRALYGSDVASSIANVHCAFETFKAAQKYRVVPLMQECMSAITRAELDFSNVCQVLAMAEHMKSEGLKKRCYKILESQTYSVMASPSFQKASESTVLSILHLNKMNLTSECQLILLLLSWAKNQYIKNHTHGTLRDAMLPLMSYLLFTDMSCAQFASIVTNHKDLFTESEALSIFMNISKPRSWELPSWYNNDERARIYVATEQES